MNTSAKTPPGDNMTNFKDFEWITPSRSGNGSKSSAAGARIVIYGIGGNRPQLLIVLYPDTMKLMRWVVGDRLDVGIDNARGLVALRRVPVNGYALGAMSVGKADREKTIGTNVASTVKVPAPAGLNACFSRVSLNPDDCAEVDGILVLSVQSK